MHPKGRLQIDPELRDRFDTSGFLHMMIFARVNSTRFKLRGYENASRKLSTAPELWIHQAIRGMKTLGNTSTTTRTYQDIRKVHLEVINWDIF